MPDWEAKHARRVQRLNALETREEILDALRTAGDKSRAHAANLDSWRKIRRIAVAHAVSARVPPTVVAETAGISLSLVYRILNEG